MDTLGKSVDPVTITAAQTIIEDEIGRTEASASGNIPEGSRDERLLRRAIAYQAVYLEAHPDLLEGFDLASFSQPDFSATLRDSGGPGGHIVAGMAARTLRKLRGVGPRSVAVESWTTRPGGDGTVDDDADASEWTPIT
jgi:hypothetical protein